MSNYYLKTACIWVSDDGPEVTGPDGRALTDDEWREYAGMFAARVKRDALGRKIEARKRTMETVPAGGLYRKLHAELMLWVNQYAEM